MNKIRIGYYKNELVILERRITPNLQGGKTLQMSRCGAFQFFSGKETTALIALTDLMKI